MSLNKDKFNKLVTKNVTVITVDLKKQRVKLKLVTCNCSVFLFHFDLGVLLV